MPRFSRASRADLAELTVLLGELFHLECEFTPEPVLQAQGLTMLLADEALGSVLVARWRGRIIAMVSLQYLVSTALGGRVALLEDLIVAQDYRGRGIGTRLLEQAIEQARAMGCRRITLLTDGDNAGAERFYRRCGFLPSAMMPMRLHGLLTG